MKRIALFFLFVLLCIGSFAQEADSAYISRLALLHYTVNDVNKADELIQELVQRYKLSVEHQKRDAFGRTGEYVLLSEQQDFDELLEELDSLGLSTLNKIETINNVDELRSVEYDLEYYGEQKRQYQQELAKLEGGERNEYYNELWESVREIDEAMYEKNKARNALLNEVRYHRIELQLSEKTAQDLHGRDDFAEFINMPGFETHFFMIENPEPSVTADAYMGASLRYMFTKGRSFFTVGAIKPILNADSSISSQANDILIYGIGKDFYPRYLGRGRRTFFNLYSGFLVGGMVLTSEDGFEHFFTAEPHFGVELFKNQFVIIDTRVGYLIPIEEDKVKILRGLNHSLSINIVF